MECISNETILQVKNRSAPQTQEKDRRIKIQAEQGFIKQVLLKKDATLLMLVYNLINPVTHRSKVRPKCFFLKFS